MKKTATVVTDKITDEISKVFDYEYSGKTEFDVPKMPALPDDFAIGLIVGPSGSGKSSMLSEFGEVIQPKWFKERAVVSHFESSDEAQDRLSAVGFNTVPSWLRPYHVLSTGEKFRADLARSIRSGAVIDEFTSVVDRTVAKSCSVALRRYVDHKKLKNIVLASCHYDIADWLEPDWVYDTATQNLSLRGSLRRPSIELEVLPCTTSIWSIFSPHHYLSGEINKGARSWVAVWCERPIGFASVLAMPSGSIKNAWREHRLVILPDYQGLGLGVRLSNTIGDIMIQDGKRYFSKTAHPRLGQYRDQSPLWKPTSKNHMVRKDYLNKSSGSKYSVALKEKHALRMCYSHEYLGNILCN